MQTPKFNIGDVVTFDSGSSTEILKVVGLRYWKDSNWYDIITSTGSSINERFLELYQKSPSSSPETKDTPIVDNQDFGEAIEILQDLWDHIQSLQELASKHAPSQVERKKQRFKRKYQRLLSILSSK